MFITEKNYLTYLNTLKKENVYKIDVVYIDGTAQPSTTIERYITSKKLSIVHGLVQIAGTTAPPTKIEKHNQKTIKLTYEYASDDTGRQHYTYLVIGE